MASICSKANKFFNIVLEPQYHKLKLPASFITKWGKNLPDQVRLKAPNGSMIKAVLIHYDGETWLHQGWVEFKEYYSIKYGHFLVFEYDGHSHFRVLIFDMTTMEIEYPIHIPNDGECVNVHSADSRMTKEKYESESEDFAPILTDFRTELKSKAKFREVTTRVNKEMQTTIMDKETCNDQMAKSFESNNPFFIVLLQPSYVSKVLNLPLTFARENLPETRNKLRLCIQGEGTWNVGCSMWLDKGKAGIYVGWRKFVRDNALKVGDVCVFEVNKMEKLLWNVIIFRS